MVIPVTVCGTHHPEAYASVNTVAVRRYQLFSSLIIIININNNVRPCLLTCDFIYGAEQLVDSIGCTVTVTIQLL